MRIIVTGSRDWPSEDLVRSALEDAELDWIARNVPGNFTVVHGGCPTGADWHAQQWAMDHGAYHVTFDVFKADWAKYGKAAGPIRNAEMVDEGADYFLAFRLNGSKGTTDCIERCKYAEIPGKVYDLTITEVP